MTEPLWWRKSPLNEKTAGWDEQVWSATEATAAAAAREA